MPVLPDVGSTSVPPGLIAPVASRWSIMLTPMRSFTLAIGLKNSSLSKISASTPRALVRRLRRTSGVLPMVCVIES